MVIGKKKRQRLDMVALDEYFRIKKMMGVRVVILEAVGGRPQQSASNAFVFGYTVGVLFTFCIVHRIPVKTVPPAVWKKQLDVPGKKIKGVADPVFAAKIITRADELMPDDRHIWRGPQGGLKVDRAESGLLALYGARYVLRIPGGVVDPTGIAEAKLVYHNAETGA